LFGKVGGICQEIRSTFQPKLADICGEFGGKPKQKCDGIVNGKLAASLKL